jgi:hypothetical protein
MNSIEKRHEVLVAALTNYIEQMKPVAHEVYAPGHMEIAEEMVATLQGTDPQPPKEVR